MAKKSNQIVIRLTKSLDRDIIYIAKKKGFSKAAWGRSILIEAVEREKDRLVSKN